MSRDPYRGGRDDFGYGGGRGVGGSGNRWDSDRFAAERGRGGGRFESERDIYEERDTRVNTRGGGFGRPRERSVDEIYERRGPRGYEDDRYERRHYHDDDEPSYERERPFGRDRGNSTSVTIEKERDVYSPPPARRGGNRPAFLRRQSSLDTFDRKPVTRFVDREDYGPPARYRPDIRPPPLTPIPLPRTRQLGPPPGRYERDYEDIRVAEPDFYGDDEFRAYPERVREREVIRRRRRSRSRESHISRSHRGSVRSSSVSSSSSSDRETVRHNEFPKRGKTRMPARLVSKKAIIDLGYPFEEEGDTIIIMKALGRENIDEVIKLSEDYKGDNDRIIETEHTTYLVGSGAEISGGRSDGGTTVFEERKTQEVFTVPPPPPGWVAPPGWVPPPPPVQEVVTDTKITETHHDHGGHHNGPIIIDGGRPHHHHDSTFVETRETQYVDRSDPIPVGPLALALPAERNRPKDERAIRAEIRALEAEKEALRAEKRADRELRKAERIRHGGRASEGDLVLYDRDTYESRNEDVTIVRRERIEEPEGGVRIEKDRKAQPPPRIIRAMLKTLT